MDDYEFIMVVIAIITVVLTAVGLGYKLGQKK